MIPKCYVSKSLTPIKIQALSQEHFFVVLYTCKTKVQELCNGEYRELRNLGTKQLR